MTVTVGHIVVSDAYEEFDAAYPVVSGMTDAGFQASLNSGMLSQVQQIVNQMHADALNVGSDITSGMVGKFTIESEVRVYRNDGNVLSLGIRMLLYSGGAVANQQSLFFTVLNAPHGRQLLLPDLFSNPPAGLARVTDDIQAQIAMDPGSFFGPLDSAVNGATMYYLDSMNLHVVFPVYAIAPGAMGEPDFALPLSDYGDILIPDISH